MADIYHALLKRDFREYNDEGLTEYGDTCADAALAIGCALRAIGNLTLDATMNEDYPDSDARRDLILVGKALRHLPRIAQALEQNGRQADFALSQRRGAAE